MFNYHSWCLKDSKNILKNNSCRLKWNASSAACPASFTAAGSVGKLVCPATGSLPARMSSSAPTSSMSRERRSRVAKFCSFRLSKFKICFKIFKLFNFNAKDFKYNGSGLKEGSNRGFKQGFSIVLFKEKTGKFRRHHVWNQVAIPLPLSIQPSISGCMIVDVSYRIQVRLLASFKVQIVKLIIRS